MTDSFTQTVRILLPALLLFVSAYSGAQTQQSHSNDAEKIGLLNYEQVIEALPDFGKFKKWEEKLKEELSREQSLRNIELVQKLREFQKNSEELDEEERERKEHVMLEKRKLVREENKKHKDLAHEKIQNKKDEMFQAFLKVLRKYCSDNGFVVVFHSHIDSGDQAHGSEKFANASAWGEDLVLFRERGVSPLRLRSYADESQKIDITKEVTAFIQLQAPLELAFE